MNKTTVAIIGAMLLQLGLAVSVSAEKKPLDHSVYDSWQSTDLHKLSKDGSIMVYSILQQDGDPQMHIRKVATGEELVVPRGTKFNMTEDGKVATLTIKSFRKDQKAKERDKKYNLPPDTLAYVRLSDLKLVPVTGKRTDLPDSVASKKAIKINSLSIARASSPLIVVDANDPKEKGRKILMFIDPETGDTTAEPDTIINVDSYTLSRYGDRMAVVTKKYDKDTTTFSSVMLCKLADRSCEVLSRDRRVYKNMSFNHDGDKLTFLATDQKSETHGSLSYSIFLAEEKIVKKATRRRPAEVEMVVRELVKEGCEDLPKGWIIGDNTYASFSNECSRLIFKLSPHMPAKDTSVIASEAAQLDIWLWDAYEVPPAARRNSVKYELTSIINLYDNPNKVITLTQTPFDQISFIKGGEGDLAWAYDQTKYHLDNQWHTPGVSDFYLVNLKDGSRSLVATRETSRSLSPTGKYIYWFSQEDAHWYCHDIQKNTTVNLTAPLGVSFQNPDVDTPSGLYSYGGPTWLGEDEYILLPDRYDIWKMQPDGQKAVCLTKGEGRKTGCQFRVMGMDALEDSHWYQHIRTRPLKGEVRLSVFDENTMKYGYGLINSASASVPQYFTEGVMYKNMFKVEGSDVIVYQKGNFNNPYDVYVTQDYFKTSDKITSVDAQLENYLWGDARLVEWTAYDGTPLKGILYTPENLDTTASYPMIVYFYEKNTQNLYSPANPAPSRSIINYPYCVSNGYVVFVPDIVYKTGHPGESAYNCICSGAEAMCKQFGFIDPKRMAIQGQSWGGYQVAYLVTRTNMFAAGGSGAPVGNMTSAYGGIRWGTGRSRISQYEHGQSRIGCTLWDEGGLDLYIENSPVFHADKINTPLLIMHNDGDGAVPWYQGIELFMAMRRLGKPAWMLQYNSEGHNLTKRKNAKDLTIRMYQFFDHYLKGAPAPAWMLYQIPQQRKGNYFGYELSE